MAARDERPARRRGKQGDALSARTQVLRGAGLRRTGPRLAVLGVLERATAPLSHADVADALLDSGFDRATVYRNLVALAEAGLVRRTDLGDHVWRFELVRSAAPHGPAHPHFVCADCGGVSCLPEVKVWFTGPKAVLARRGVEVQLRGVCDGCAEPAARRGARRA